jgi:hypothetical protein
MGVGKVPFITGFESSAKKKKFCVNHVMLIIQPFIYLFSLVLNVFMLCYDLSTIKLRKEK